MSEQIDRFLSSLENWKESFEVKNFDTTGDDELSQIIAMQRNKDVDGLLKIWERKLEQDYFELPHPIFSDVITRAVYSVQHGMANFVFMVDSGNKFPWVFGQCQGFIDYILTNEYHFKASLSIESPVVDKIKNLHKLKSKYLRFENRRFGFLLGQARPYHFFYDHLKYFCFLKELNNGELYKPLREEKSFFKINEVSSFVDDNVLLFPAVIGNNTLSQRSSGRVKELNEKMEKAVYNNAVKNFVFSGEVNALRIWYGITGQKRSWLQQVDGAENIIKKLLPHFNEIELYVDGMTASEGNTIRNADDEAVLKKIENRLEGQCRIQSLIGQDYRHKVRVCSTVDLFIANAGTGCMVPLRFCKKPGTLHSNTRFFTFPDSYPETIKKSDKKYVIDVQIEGKERADLSSYHIPWQHIFNLTAEVLNKIKGTNIKPLEVPPVEEVAKHYDKQQKAQKQKLMAFTAIENRVKPTHKSPDILREVALSFEQSGDIETALKIMQKALELRPSGPFIKRKVLEYQAIIESASQKEK